jgi:energy-coupling factor transport system permease protein
MWSDSAHPFHIGAWLLWLAAALVLALDTRNPVYLALLIAAASLVALAISSSRRGDTTGVVTTETAAGVPLLSGQMDRSRGLLLKAVVALMLAVTLLKGFSLHLGTTVLFALPDSWPVIGGPITLESLVFSALDALSIFSILAVFTAFGAGADYYALLRSLPPFLHQVGLITSIGITFVPQTVDRFVEIREATAMRGHRIRRVRDLLPLFMPLLAGGMEKSMNLAEAMEARGFSKNSGQNIHKIPPLMIQSGLTGGVGLILIGGALLAFASTIPVIGWFTILAGATLLFLTLRALGLGSKRTRIRRARWYERDICLASLSAGSVVCLVTYRVLMPSAFVYYPFPSLYVPPVDPVVCVALLLLLAPIALLKGSRGGT